MELAPMSREAWQVQQFMQQSMELYTKMPGLGITMDDLDEVKDFFRSGAMRAILTYALGLAQASLSVLAFQSDVAFFHGRRVRAGPLFPFLPPATPAVLPELGG